MDEVVKLSHIYCDLRVVIGYLPMHRRSDGEDEKCLRYIVDVMKNYCNSFSTLTNANSEFMVIIGNSCTKADKPETFFNYKGLFPLTKCYLILK